MTNQCALPVLTVFGLFLAAVAHAQQPLDGMIDRASRPAGYVQDAARRSRIVAL